MQAAFTVRAWVYAKSKDVVCAGMVVWEVPSTVTHYASSQAAVSSQLISAGTAGNTWQQMSCRMLIVIDQLCTATPLQLDTF